MMSSCSRYLFCSIVLFVNLGILRCSQAQEQSVPRFERTECFLENPEQGIHEKISYGYLIVPESRNRSDSRLLKIAVCILHSLNEDAKSDPVIFLAGGPGGKGIGTIEFWAGYPLRKNRDIILMDFRGIGYSEPSMGSNLAEERLVIFARDLTPKQEIEAWTEIFLPGLQQMKESGIDLGAYNSATIAADVEDLRLALGVEKWNLYGISYGTRIAQAIMRDYPHGIRSVILDSPVPIGQAIKEDHPGSFARALEKIAAAYQDSRKADDPDADLLETYRALLSSLTKQPLAMAVPQDLGWGSIEHFIINAQDLNSATHHLLYNTEVYPIIPLLVHSLAQGETRPMMSLFKHLKTFLGYFSPGHTHLVEKYECSVLNLLTNYEREEARLDWMHPGLPVIKSCFYLWQQWDSPVNRDFSARPVYSDLPVLILSGDFDPITPPSYGKTMAERMSNGYFFIFPASGHGVSSHDPGARSMVESFVADPSSEPDSQCLEAMGNPTFYARIFVNPLIGPFLNSVMEGGKRIQVGILGLCVLVFTLTVVFWVIGTAVSLLRRKALSKSRARPKIVIAGRALALLWLVLWLCIVAGLWHTLQTCAPLLLFGLPFWVWGFMWLAYLLCILSVIYLVWGCVIVSKGAGSWWLKTKVLTMGLAAIGATIMFTYLGFFEGAYGLI